MSETLVSTLARFDEQTDIVTILGSTPRLALARSNGISSTPERGRLFVS